VVKGFLKLKRLFSLVIVGLPVGVLTTALFCGSVSPSSAAHQTVKRCSLATLNGTYVFANDGFQMIGGKEVPFSSAGQEKYDGNGHMNGVFSGVTGQSVSHQIRYTGTYSITPECLMTLTFTDTTGVTSHYDQYVSPDGRFFSFAQTDPGFVTSGWEVRVNPGTSGALPFQDMQP
jgi:hypothetical protein